jgi:hypothetical protein
VNGVTLPSTKTYAELKGGKRNLTIVSEATLTSGGSSIEADCTGGPTTTADSNLALIRVDALN